MDKLEIFNTALALFNDEVTQADLDSSAPSKVVKLCNRFYESAKQMAMRESDWSFLVTCLTIDYTSDLDGIGCGGYIHGYPLPSGLFKLTNLNNVEHVVIGNYFCTDSEDPDIYGIMATLPTTVPAQFEMLVAFALAYLIAPSVAPGNGLEDEILRRYTWISQSLLSAEVSARYVNA